MKTAIVGAGLIVAVFFVPVLSRAQEAQAPAAATTEAQAPVEVGNKICPVSGEKVGEHGMEPEKITHNGKAYNLCCGMCAMDFKKDPDKYAGIADKEVSVK